MAGRRPKPIRLKLLQGNPGKRPIRGFFEPPKPSKPPNPPDFLKGEALDEWSRVVPGLMVFGLLTEIDTMPLAAYCMAYARWRDAEELLAELETVDERGRGLLVKGSKGQARSNPLIQIAREAASDMVRFAGEFGFSPAARARIAGGPFAHPGHGKFAGLIAGLDHDLA